MNNNWLLAEILKIRGPPWSSINSLQACERLAFSDRMSEVMNGFWVLDEHEMFLNGACLSSRDDSVDDESFKVRLQCGDWNFKDIRRKNIITKIWYVDGFDWTYSFSKPWRSGFAWDQQSWQFAWWSEMNGIEQSTWPMIPAQAQASAGMIGPADIAVSCWDSFSSPFDDIQSLISAMVFTSSVRSCIASLALDCLNAWVSQHQLFRRLQVHRLWRAHIKMVLALIPVAPRCRWCAGAKTADLNGLSSTMNDSQLVQCSTVDSKGYLESSHELKS